MNDIEKSTETDKIEAAIERFRRVVYDAARSGMIGRIVLEANVSRGGIRTPRVTKISEEN